MGRFGKEFAGGFLAHNVFGAALVREEICWVRLSIAKLCYNSAFLYMEPGRGSKDLFNVDRGLDLRDIAIDVVL